MRNLGSPRPPEETDPDGLLFKCQSLSKEQETHMFSPRLLQVLFGGHKLVDLSAASGRGVNATSVLVYQGLEH
jgi:hypothetical protein